MNKFIMAALSHVLLMGCATAIPYSREEVCAREGMRLTGTHHGSGAATTFVPIGNTFYPMSTASETSDFNCDLPKSPEESCFIDAYRQEMAPKDGYNDGIGGKKTVTGFGYLLFIVPGVTAKILYDRQSSRAEEESRAIASTAFQKCGTK